MRHRRTIPAALAALVELVPLAVGSGTAGAEKRTAPKKAAKAAKAAKATKKAAKAGTAATGAAQTTKRAAGTGWVEPVDGNCPSTHPVKAKMASRIFHLPGMSAYNRTSPDRCYADAAAAASDGLRPAKR